LLPGVTIASGAYSASCGQGCGNLTITTDLNFAGLRYSDPTALFGIAQTGTLGSGEPGSVVFRAGNTLYVNGSVSDGFGDSPFDT
ncbi:hypothetical protein, partial [Shewanella algae]|uniref:hypothetical protein n=1 Tax=Shewanella algae TaxID=38313 RepID=UPI00313C0D41